MTEITRRSALGGLAVLGLPISAHGASPEDLNVDAGGGPVDLTRYAADGAGKRSAVLLLHGSRGVELKPRAYERHAIALATGGIDAYLVRYFTVADWSALDGKINTPEAMDIYRTDRFPGWVERIKQVVTGVLERPECSGHVGLLGFSLGAYVAVDAAAHDDRVTAVGVMYGGMPNAQVAEVTHLPPILIIYGDADSPTVVEKGEELLSIARRVRAQAELVSYPDRQHGFDFADSDPMTADAIERVVRFFQARLSTG
jgi:carboxymethylenebutenolidase